MIEELKRFKDRGNSRQLKINNYLINTFEYCLRVNKQAIKGMTPDQLRMALLINMGIKTREGLIAALGVHENNYKPLRDSIPDIPIVSAREFIMIPMSLIMTLSARHLWYIAYIQTSSWCELSVNNTPNVGPRGAYYLIEELPVFTLKNKVYWLEPDLYIQLIRLSRKCQHPVEKLREQIIKEKDQ